MNSIFNSQMVFFWATDYNMECTSNVQTRKAYFIN